MKKIYFFYIIFFALIAGIMVHELIHILQVIKEKGTIEEVCFLGYNGKGVREGAVGWVTSTNEANYDNHNRDEILPTIAGIITTFGITLGLLYDFYKDKI